MCKQQKIIIDSNLSIEQIENVKATLIAAGFTPGQIVIGNQNNHQDEHQHIDEPKKKTFAEIIKEYGLNDQQVELLKSYSMERSRRAYERVAAKEIGDNDLIKDWRYAGCYDAGYRGADYCSAGHALRYVHIAKNVITGKEIKFGIKCVKDFFDLTDAQIKFIKNGFAESNQEVTEILDTYMKFNGSFDEYEKQYHYQEKLHFILEKDASIIYFDHDKLEHLFKLGMVKEFFKLQLPLPCFYEITIDRAYKKLMYFIQKNSQQNEKKKEQSSTSQYAELLQYLQQNHNSAYTILISLLKAQTENKMTDKQQYLLNKLLFTKWTEFDKIATDYQQKKIKIKSSFIDAFNNIITTYVKWGATDKQLTLLKKAIV